MGSTPWRLIRSRAMSGAENMALDEVLLESVARGDSPPVLRLYRWQPAAVTLGYGQRGADVVDTALCRSLGIDIVRRITGGRAVLHDREATYAVISAERSDLFPGGILGNYRVIAEVLQRTLADFGLGAEPAPARERCGAEDGFSLRNICFTAPSTYELLYRGCKVTGSAQKRWRGAFLQHGSIPLDLDLERLFRILNPGAGIDPTEGARVLARNVGWINRWREHPVSLDELEERLLSNFIEGWGMTEVESRPTVEELQRMKRLAAHKYADLYRSQSIVPSIGS